MSGIRVNVVTRLPREETQIDKVLREQEVGYTRQSDIVENPHIV